MKREIVFFLAAAFGCGGSAPPPAPPKSHEPAEPKAKSETPAPEPLRARRSTVECEDGSCFSCGEAVCLAGFYCAIGRAGRGCAWLPSCATKPSCACLSSALRDDPSCTCEERDNGVYVACDGVRP